MVDRRPSRPVAARAGRLSTQQQTQHNYTHVRGSVHARAQTRGDFLASGGSNRLMSVQEVADYLGVPKTTIYDRWKEWGLPAHRVGRHLRFRERNVETWLERQAA